LAGWPCAERLARAPQASAGRFAKPLHAMLPELSCSG